MNLNKCILTENECYVLNKKYNNTHKVNGLMLHSTGANNPYISRYVAPDDGKLGTPSSNHWNQYRPNGRQVCVHGFIGKLKDGSVATYQTLPFDMVGWHSGNGNNGNANFMGYLGFEICEDDLTSKTYFNAVYKEAVELFAYLCNEYDLDPFKNIICHSEGYKLGIASNHADVMHWFPKFGKNMDTFRQDVSNELNKIKSAFYSEYDVAIKGIQGLENAKKLVNLIETQGYKCLLTESKNGIANNKLPSLSENLEKEGAKMYSVEQALDILVENKIINTKGYWLSNYQKLQYLDTLIINMANFIKPHQEETQPSTPTVIKPYYTETANQTRRIFMSPLSLKIDCFDTAKNNNSFLGKYKFATNGTFFGGTTCSVTPLIIDGKFIRWASNYGKQQSCIIIYKDGTVEMKKLNTITDLGNKLYSVKHLIGGVGIVNNDDKNFVYNPDSEGYTGTVKDGIERKCNKTVLAYIKATNELVLMTRPNIHHTQGYSLIQLCKDCEFDYAISLDGSGSTFTIADSVYKLKGDGRGIFTVLHAE